MYKGIYILVTKDGYRLFAGNVLGIYDEIDPETGRFILDASVVKQVFGPSQVFTNQECVLQAAQEVAKITGELDDGIFWIRDIVSEDFDEFVSGVQ